MDILLEKKKVLESLQSSLPEKFSVDTIIEHILFLQAVEEGLEQSAQSDVISLADAKKRFEK